MYHGVARSQSQRGPIFGDSLIQFTLVIERRPEVAVCHGQVWLEPQCLSVLGDFLFHFPLGAERHTEVIVGDGVIGVGA
jgi:hypothetical protein